MRPPVQLWLCTQPTDMRRSYDGLAAMVRRQLGQIPLSGHGFRKRLERGRFAALSPTAGKAIALSHAEFEALIEGLDLVVTKRRQRWHPKLSAA